MSPPPDLTDLRGSLASGTVVVDTTAGLVVRGKVVVGVNVISAGGGGPEPWRR